MPDQLAEKEKAIESLRHSLNLLVTVKKGNMADTEVMELSSILDQLIVEYEQQKIKKAAKRGI